MYADDMFKTDQGFKDALAACYVKLNNTSLYGRDLTITRIELMAQLWDFSYSSGSSTLIAFKELDFSTSDSKSFFSAVYGAQYNVIVQANDILKNIPVTGDYIEYPATRAVIEAEALAIRAFCHFDILRMFGQMPKNPSKKVELPYAKTVGREPIPYYGYEEFLKLILEDLTAAEELFKVHDPLTEYTLAEMDAGSNLVEDGFLNYRRFRFNLYAVKALKARIYMYAGNPTDAYKYAKEVIDAVSASGNAMVALAGNNDLDNNYYALPTECIFALNNHNLASLSSIFSWASYAISLEHFEELFAGLSSFSNNRKLKAWNSSIVDSNGNKYATVRKYDQPGAGEDVASSVLTTRRQLIPMIRLSEMYLIVMETGTLAEANELYVDYMAARSEITSASLTQSEMEDFLEDEYRREFFAEGQMFYYYKRKGSTTMLWRIGGALTEDNYVVPLPATELNQNN